MAKQVKVMGIDTIKQTFKGKECDVLAINLLNIEKGSTKKEYIPSFNKVYTAAAVLQVGDMCNATWEKNTVNGKDYFNLVELTKTGSEAMTAAETSGGYTAKTTKGFTGKDPDVQTSIARQNVNNVAMQFVTKMLEQGVYPKKSTPDMLFEEIKRFSKKFEAYVTLKDDYTQLDAPTVIGTPSDDEGMFD
jgi:hypothetical protein